MERDQASARHRLRAATDFGSDEFTSKSTWRRLEHHVTVNGNLKLGQDTHARTALDTPQLQHKNTRRTPAHERTPNRETSPTAHTSLAIGHGRTRNDVSQSINQRMNGIAQNERGNGQGRTTHTSEGHGRTHDNERHSLR